MARLKLGAIITNISGKLGGHQLGNNNGTVILQNKSVTNKNGTNSQYVRRSQTNYLMKQWSILTDDQRREWYLQIKNYKVPGTFGDIKTFSGFTLFQKLNQGRLNINENILLSPPQYHKPSLPVNLNVNATETTLVIQSDNYISSDTIAVYASPMLSKGISKPKKYMRFIANVTDAQLNSGIDVYSAYVSKFGNLVNGNNIFIGNKTFSTSSGYSNGVLVINEKTVVGGGNVVTNFLNYLENKASVNNDFVFVDRAGNNDSGLQDSGTDGQWCIELSGSTPSGGTGATSNPPSRSGFIYNEGSSPSGTSSSWAMKYNNSVDNNYQNLYLDLIYNLHAVATNFKIQYATVANPNNTTDWTTLNQINSNNVDTWVSNTFDFSLVPTTETLWIRINLFTPYTFTCDLSFSTFHLYGVLI